VTFEDAISLFNVEETVHSQEPTNVQKHNVKEHSLLRGDRTRHSIQAVQSIVWVTPLAAGLMTPAQ
jgi:hypothetical protein